MDDAAIVILAGGKATRFPGKLEHSIDGVPMLLRVYRNARATPWPVYVAAGNGSFTAAITAQLDCPILADEHPGAGPLAALFSACAKIDAQHVFAIAGDAPNLDPSLLEQLAAAWQPGDEAVIPEHPGRIEPLAALYAREAVRRESLALMQQGNRSMHALVERIRARFLTLPSEYFLNVNTPADLPSVPRTPGTPV